MKWHIMSSWSSKNGSFQIRLRWPPGNPASDGLEPSLAENEPALLRLDAASVQDVQQGRRQTHRRKNCHLLAGDTSFSQLDDSSIVKKDLIDYLLWSIAQCL